MRIYNSSSIEILNTSADDSSVRHRSIAQPGSLTLNFSTVDPVTIPVGSYVEFEGQRYTLFYPENFKKHSTRNFEYTLVLHDSFELLKLYKYKDLSATPYRLKFVLTARPADFLQLLVDNMNLYDSGWSAGDCVEADEKTISFNHEYCFDVAARLMSEFNTEIEVEGKTIHLRKIEKFKEDPLPLSYGKGNGFKSGVGRQNEGDKQPIGRLYVQGGERNIDFSEYGSQTLLLPKSATLEVDGKTYCTDADGMYIIRDGNSNPLQDSYDASDIYPKRVGVVSEVVVVDEEDSMYDIIDSSIPESLDYSECVIAGEKATIVFQSGALAGREFDIHTDDKGNLIGYDHKERKFQIVPAELDGYVMPGGVFVPEVGDKYAIFNISMPTAYISDNNTQTGASWDMFREAVRYFADNEEPKFVFSGELDGVWSRSKWLEIGGKIVPGGYVLFSDTQFQPDGIPIRITGIKDYINKPHKPEITLSNAPLSLSFAADLGKLEAEEVVREADKKEVMRFSKRQWRDTRETMKMLQGLIAEMPDFTEAISPITIQTMQLIAGSESLQFRFVNNKTSPAAVTHNVLFNGENKVLTASAGIIQHMTLGITTLKKSHAANEYKYWDMAAYTSPPLDANKAYYLYAKCAKSGNSGTFLLSESTIAMEGVSGYYHLLVGILNSESDGDRSFAALYGFTEILPGRVTTDKIVSQDGKTVFDLVNGVISGKIRFINSNNELEDLDSASSGETWQIVPSTSSIYRPTSGSDEPTSISCEVVKGKGETMAVFSSSLPSGFSMIRKIDNGNFINYTPGSSISTSSINSSVEFRLLAIIGKSPTAIHKVVIRVVKDGEKGDAGSDGIAGKDGVGIIKTTITYARGTSGSTKPTDGWQEQPPTPIKGQYLWTRTVWDYSDGTSETGYSSAYWATDGARGDDGIAGKDGVSITKTTITYAQSISGTIPPTSGWTPDPPTPIAGRYIWTKMEWTYSDDTTEIGYSVGRIGEKGDDGDGYLFRYKRSNTRPDRPATGDMQPAGWMSEIDFPDNADIYWPSITGGWSAENGEYKSEPIGHGKQTSMRLQFYNRTPGSEIKITVRASSESYDRAYVGKLDQELGDTFSNYHERFGGNESRDYSYHLPQAGEHFIEIGYKKDNSVSSLDDAVYVKLELPVQSVWMTMCEVVNGIAGGWSLPVLFIDNRIEETIAALNRTKAITDKFGTTVDGGLIQSVMMSLREADTMTETAGVSGIQGISKDNPAFWSGGTYTQALAFIEYLSKIKAGTTPGGTEYNSLANIALMHSGAAKLGDLIVEESGRVLVVDPLTAKARLVFDINNLQPLSQLLSNNVASQTVNVGAGSTSSSTILPGSVTVSQGGSLTIEPIVLRVEGKGMLSTSGYESYVTASIKVLRGDVPVAGLYPSAQIWFDGEFETEKSATVETELLILENLSAGQYRLMLEVYTGGVVSNPRAISGPSTMQYTWSRTNVNYQLYGLDGMMFFYSDNHFYFTENGGLDIRGKTNMPGVLATGTVAANGGQANVWGAKSNPTGAGTITGGRRVYLSNMKHKNYTVLITPHTSTSAFRVSTKEPGYFDALGTGAFDYVVLGNNY